MILDSELQDRLLMASRLLLIITNIVALVTLIFSVSNTLNYCSKTTAVISHMGLLQCTSHFHHTFLNLNYEKTSNKSNYMISSNQSELRSRIFFLQNFVFRLIIHVSCKSSNIFAKFFFAKLQKILTGGGSEVQIMKVHSQICVFFTIWAMLSVLTLGTTTFFTAKLLKVGDWTDLSLGWGLMALFVGVGLMALVLCLSFCASVTKNTPPKASTEAKYIEDDANEYQLSHAF